MHAEKITQLLSAKSYPADFAAKTQNPVSCAALSSWQTWHWIHLSWWDYDHLYLLICCGRPWVRWVDEGGGPVETGCQDWYYPLHPFRCSQTVMRRSSIRSCLRSCCYGEWHFKTLQSDCLQGFFMQVKMACCTLNTHLPAFAPDQHFQSYTKAQLASHHPLYLYCHQTHALSISQSYDIRSLAL